MTILNEFFRENDLKQKGVIEQLNILSLISTDL